MTHGRIDWRSLDGCNGFGREQDAGDGWVAAIVEFNDIEEFAKRRGITGGDPLVPIREAKVGWRERVLL
ncbi:hypothetical protein [Caballeronia novacaledonica]|uniref:Uncharacterized protein n=1 Tax=Caballeronia novacaledonica TaxID=1544861 RepID=A0AA37MJX1_9BURK|nr:hypothetical protein [Caballeronia novacaledonica]GJH30690.1 hypothetical protein CBA19CS42_39260 [Caballeronia novacaledonica]